MFVFLSFFLSFSSMTRLLSIFVLNVKETVNAWIVGSMVHQQISDEFGWDGCLKKGIIQSKLKYIYISRWLRVKKVIYRTLNVRRQEEWAVNEIISWLWYCTTIWDKYARKVSKMEKKKRSWSKRRALPYTTAYRRRRVAEMKKKKTQGEWAWKIRMDRGHLWLVQHLNCLRNANVKQQCSEQTWQLGEQKQNIVSTLIEWQSLHGRGYERQSRKIPP